RQDQRTHRPGGPAGDAGEAVRRPGGRGRELGRLRVVRAAAPRRGHRHLPRLHPLADGGGLPALDGRARPGRPRRRRAAGGREAAAGGHRRDALVVRGGPAGGPQAELTRGPAESGRRNTAAAGAGHARGARTEVRAPLENPCVRAYGSTRYGSGRNDVLRLRALLALGDVEGHLLAFLELAEARGGDVRVVGEDVSAAAVLLDEAEALFRVEPLHRTGGHIKSPETVPGKRTLRIPSSSR